MNTTYKLLGDAGEEYVAQWLVNQGFSIIARNYTQKIGEIDIIARNATTLIFVEVKTRKRAHFALSEVITHHKQRKITKTAAYFLARNDYSNYIIRFDVALLQGTVLDYIANAFVPHD